MGLAVIDKSKPIRSIGLRALGVFFGNIIESNPIVSLSNKILIDFGMIKRHGADVIDIRVVLKTVVRVRVIYP